MAARRMKAWISGLKQMKPFGNLRPIDDASYHEKKERGLRHETDSLVHWTVIMMSRKRHQRLL